MKALLVDDEKPARDRFKRLLKKFNDVEVIGEASDGIQALEEIDRLKPDVVFLDIEMPVLNGLAVAEALKDQGLLVVFVTAFNEHALKAFEVAAVDYLVKPVAEARLAAAIAKLRIRTQNAPVRDRKYQELLQNLNQTAVQKLAIRCGSKYVAFEPEKISAILARDHYAALIMGDREFLADDSIDSLISRLNPAIFLRIHRAAAINLQFLKELEREGDRKYTAVLNDQLKTKVPIARERLSELKSRLGLS